MRGYFDMPRACRQFDTRLWNCISFLKIVPSQNGHGAERAERSVLESNKDHARHRPRRCPAFTDPAAAVAVFGVERRQPGRFDGRPQGRETGRYELVINLKTAKA